MLQKVLGTWYFFKKMRFLPVSKIHKSDGFFPSDSQQPIPSHPRLTPVTHFVAGFQAASPK